MYMSCRSFLVHVFVSKTKQGFITFSLSLSLSHTHTHTHMVQSHLAQCLRELSYTSSFPSVVSMLTDHERQTLYSIGIQCK